MFVTFNVHHLPFNFAFSYTKIPSFWWLMMNDSIPDVVIVVDKSEFYERFGFSTVFTNMNGILDFVESEKSKRAL